jgi:hypothetical protein
MQAISMDLGFVETAVDKIVDSANLPDGSSRAFEDTKYLAQRAFAQHKSPYGIYTAAVVWRVVPRHLLFMSPLWIAKMVNLPTKISSKMLLPRLYRLLSLLQYFREVCLGSMCHIRRILGIAGRRRTFVRVIDAIMTGTSFCTSSAGNG